MGVTSGREGLAARGAAGGGALTARHAQSGSGGRTPVAAARRGG